MFAKRSLVTELSQSLAYGEVDGLVSTLGINDEQSVFAKELVGEAQG